MVVIDQAVVIVHTGDHIHKVVRMLLAVLIHISAAHSNGSACIIQNSQSELFIVQVHVDDGAVSSAQVVVTVIAQNNILLLSDVDALQISGLFEVGLDGVGGNVVLINGLCGRCVAAGLLNGNSNGSIFRSQTDQNSLLCSSSGVLDHAVNSLFDQILCEGVGRHSYAVTNSDGVDAGLSGSELEQRNDGILQQDHIILTQLQNDIGLVDVNGGLLNFLCCKGNIICDDCSRFSPVIVADDVNAVLYACFQIVSISAGFTALRQSQRRVGSNVKNPELEAGVSGNVDGQNAVSIGGVEDLNCVYLADGAFAVLDGNALAGLCAFAAFAALVAFAAFTGSQGNSALVAAPDVDDDNVSFSNGNRSCAGIQRAIQGDPAIGSGKAIHRGSYGHNAVFSCSVDIVNVVVANEDIYGALQRINDVVAIRILLEIVSGVLLHDGLTCNKAQIEHCRNFFHIHGVQNCHIDGVTGVHIDSCGVGTHAVGLANQQGVRTHTEGHTQHGVAVDGRNSNGQVASLSSGVGPVRSHHRHSCVGQSNIVVAQSQCAAAGQAFNGSIAAGLVAAFAAFAAITQGDGAFITTPDVDQNNIAGSNGYRSCTGVANAVQVDPAVGSSVAVHRGSYGHNAVFRCSVDVVDVVVADKDIGRQRFDDEIAVAVNFEVISGILLSGSVAAFAAFATFATFADSQSNSAFIALPDIDQNNIASSHIYGICTVIPIAIHSDPAVGCLIAVHRRGNGYSTGSFCGIDVVDVVIADKDIYGIYQRLNDILAFGILREIVSRILICRSFAACASSPGQGDHCGSFANVVQNSNVNGLAFAHSDSCSIGVCAVGLANQQGVHTSAESHIQHAVAVNGSNGNGQAASLGSGVGPVRSCHRHAGISQGNIVVTQSQCAAAGDSSGFFFGIQIGVDLDVTEVSAGVGSLPAGVAILPDVHTNSVLGLVQHLGDGNVTAELGPVGLIDLGPLAAVFQDQNDLNGGNIALTAVVDGKLINSSIAGFVVAQIQVQVSSFSGRCTEGEVGSQVTIDEVAQRLPVGSAIRPPGKVSIAVSSCGVATASANNSTGQIDLLLFRLSRLNVFDILPGQDAVNGDADRIYRVSSASFDLDGLTVGNGGVVAVANDDVHLAVYIHSQLHRAVFRRGKFTEAIGFDSDLVICQDRAIGLATGDFDLPGDPGKALAKVLDSVGSASSNLKAGAGAHTQATLVDHNVNSRLTGQSSSAGILSSPLVGSAAFQHKAGAFCCCKCGRCHECDHSDNYQSSYNFFHSVFLLKNIYPAVWAAVPCGKMCAEDIHIPF